MLFENYDFDMALYKYADHLTANYNSTGSTGGYSISYVKGRKFLKVVMTSWNSPSVHSFICIKEHDGWKYGDILKAASWAQPAKNFARGNVLNTDSYKNHRWTGA
jgi:hypothetical protein